MAPVTSILKQEHFNKLVSRDKLTVVLYFAEWCGYCRLFDPVYERIVARREYRDVTFCSIDCTPTSKELDYLQGRAKADGFPHIAVFRGGKLFAKKVGYSEFGTFKEWLTDCMLSNAISRSPGKSSRSKDAMEKLHAMEVAGKRLLQTVSSFDEINSMASETKHLLVAFYKKSRPGASEALWAAWERAVSRPETEHIRLVTYDCDEDEDLADGFFLLYQSRCWFFRDGVMFSEWKSAGSRLSCEVWLQDCLAASEMADPEPASTDLYSESKADDKSGHETEEIVTGSPHSDGVEQSASSNLEARDVSGEDVANQGESEESEEQDDSKLIYVTSEDQWQELLSEHAQVVVTFYDYCRPYSQAALLILERIAQSAVFEPAVFCAIECNEEVAEALELKECPDIRLFLQRMQVAKIDRALAQPDLQAWLTASLGTPCISPPEEIAEAKAELPTAQALNERNGDDGHLNSEGDTHVITVDTVVDILAEVDISAEQGTSTMVMTSTSLIRQEEPMPADNPEHSTARMEIVASPKSTLSPASATSDESLFERASTWLHNENHSSSSLTSVSTISTINSHSLPPCTGLHQDRPKPRFRWLGKRQPFHDPEPGCVFVPTVDGEGLQIGRANEGDSYFNITLSQSHDDLEKDKVTFGVGFGPDPTMKTRFVSSVFRVTFGYDNDSGGRVPLKIRDLSPKDEHGETTEVHWGRGSESSVNMSLGYSSVSLGGESKRSKNADYTRKTSSRVRGQGIHTPTAEWTFQEDEGEAGRHGLDPQYQMSVTLPHVATTRTIWMEFWGKAVLARGRSLTGLDVTLKIGSIEEPYRRNLELSSGISTAH